jgi:hypothetical protein
MDERSHHGTKQRVIACRKRLRRTRAKQKATDRVEGVRPPAASERAELSSDARTVESEEILSRAGARTLQKKRVLMPEVDRRPTLRAR